MKRCSMWVKLALLVCAVLTVVSAPHTSLAYISARSNTLQNFFRVVYLPPQEISVPVMIQKTIVNLSEEEVSPGGFEFHLINVETGETTVATSADDGLAAMHLTFSVEDVGKTYLYRLYELNTGREHIIYDNTVYDISVTLVLNDTHEISAQLMVNGQPVTEIIAEYKNQYYMSTPLPDTGDHAYLLLWTVMLVVSGTALVLLRKKQTYFQKTVEKRSEL